MQVAEYGKDHSSVIILLHGGGLSWWNYQEAAALLGQKYHVVIPLLDGHAGSDRDFTSIQESAAELGRYITKEFGGHVYAIGGLSLGGQILVELLGQAPEICQKAVIESALIKPMPFTHHIIGPLTRASYSLMKQPWFARLQFAQLHIKPSLYADYYADTCKITADNLVAILQSNSCYQPPASLAELQNSLTKVAIAVGGKEPRIMRQSAQELHAILPQSKLLVFPDYRHGELSMAHAQKYVALFEG